MCDQMTLPSQPRSAAGSYRALFGLALCISTSWQILLSVVPALAEQSGPHGMAGLATAALSLGAVLGELSAPALMTRVPSRALLVAGQATTCLASLVLLLPRIASAAIVASTAVRGLGMGMALVVSVALLIQGTPAARRGTEMGKYGLALSLPSVLVPSLGVYLLSYGRSDLDALIAAASSAAGIAFALRTPSSGPVGAAEPRWPRLASQPRLLIVFAALTLTCTSFGAVVTYAPVALPLKGFGSAATFLLVAGAFRAFSRWLAGPASDRFPLRRVLGAGTLLTAAGVLMLAMRAGDASVLVAALAFGAGFGVVQTAGFLAMTRLNRGAALVSTLWNVGTDFGAATGGALLGLGAVHFGYLAAIWLFPALVLVSSLMFSISAEEVRVARVASEASR